MWTKIGNPAIPETIAVEVFSNLDLVYGPGQWQFTLGEELSVLKPLEPADIYFITTNSGKVASAQRSLGDRFTIRKLGLTIAENGTSIEEIAEHKARIGYAVTCKPVISDDSGFIIPSLNGWPGIGVGRELEQHGLQYFSNLARTARGQLPAYWQMAVTYFSGVDPPKTFTSEVHGSLIDQIRGNLSQPFVKSQLASCFVISGQDKTIAEMTAEEYKTVASTDRWRLLREFLEKPG